jgi:alanyl-tRNA synthetase
VVVSGEERRIAELEGRVEELLRVNERLGRELTEAGAGRRPATATTSAFAVAKLVRERDSAADRATELKALEELVPQLEHLQAENENLRRELARLRGGYAGLLRRARARLRRS